MNMKVYLRALEQEDYKTIAIWRNDTEITDLLGGNRFYVSESREKGWVEQAIKDDRRNLYLGICLKDKNEIIGLVNLTSIDMLNQKAEFSILIGNKEYHGKGLGKISTELMLKHAFEQMNLNKVWLTVLSQNKKAIKLYKGIGFHEEGVVREDVYKNNKYQDMIMMSILKSEYDRQL